VSLDPTAVKAAAASLLEAATAPGGRGESFTIAQHEFTRFGTTRYFRPETMAAIDAVSTSEEVALPLLIAS
jgi:hypothetical protein